MFNQAHECFLGKEGYKYLSMPRCFTSKDILTLFITQTTERTSPTLPTMTDSLEPALRILPREIERLAITHPNSTWMTSPTSAGQAGHWKNITYLQLSNAVNGLAMWAEEQLGAGNQMDVVAYIG